MLVVVAYFSYEYTICPRGRVQYILTARTSTKTNNHNYNTSCNSSNIHATVALLTLLFLARRLRTEYSTILYPITVRTYSRTVQSAFQTKLRTIVVQYSNHMRNGANLRSHPSIWMARHCFLVFSYSTVFNCTYCTTS